VPAQASGTGAADTEGTDIEAAGLSIDPLRWVSDADSYAPPLGNAEEVFFEMKKVSLESFEGDLVILCRVLVTGGNFDILAEPDLIMELGVADGPKVKQWGGLNQSVGYVSYPARGIPNGASIHLAVMDQDLTTVEFIGEASETFDGRFPVDFETRNLTATCRADSLDHLGGRFRSRLADADRGLGKLDHVAPKPRTANWGFPSSLVQGVRASLSGAAAFVGWENPEVASRARALARFEQGFSVSAAASVERTAVALETREIPVPGAGMALSVVETSCRPALAMPIGIYLPAQPSLVDRTFHMCTVRLQVEITIQAPVVLDAASTTLGLYDEFRLVAANGATADLAFSEGSCMDGLAPESADRRVSIPSGQTCELVLTGVASGTGHLPEEPRLLWIDSKTAKPVLFPL